jgi:hypothetical protein
MMDLVAYRTSHRLIYMFVLCDILGGKTLYAVSGFGAAVNEKRHGEISETKVETLCEIRPAPPASAHERLAVLN